MIEFFVHNWPYIFLTIILLYLLYQYVIYINEEPEFDLGLVKDKLPDSIELFRPSLAISKKGAIFYYLALVSSLVVLFGLKYYVILSGSEDLSTNEIIEKTFGLSNKEDSKLADMLIIFLFMFLYPLVAYAVGKNERLVLSSKGIEYVPMFKTVLNDLVAWKLEWAEIESIKFRSERLSIKPIRGKVRHVMPHLWFRINEEDEPNCKSIFSKLLCKSRLSRDIELQIKYYHLLRYINENTDIEINREPGKGINFDLSKNKSTRLLIWVMSGLMLYAFLDGGLNSEAYIGGYPYYLFLGVGIIAFIASVVWLSSKPVPKIVAWGMALMVGFISFITAYPAALRINQFTDINGLKKYEFKKAEPYVYKSINMILPDVDVPVSKYWNTLSNDEIVSFSIRKGGLGFYQIDMEPIYVEIRNWNKEDREMLNETNNKNR